MMKYNTIIVIGEWNSPNLGDRVLCTTYKKLLRKRYPSIKIIDFDISSNTKFNHIATVIIYKLLKIFNLSHFAQIFNRYSTSRIVKKKIQHIVKKYDHNCMAVVAGGALIGNYFALPLAAISEILDNHNIPIIYNAVGVGQKLSKKSYKLFHILLNRKNVVSITSRDKLSDLHLVNSPVKCIPDVAVASSKCYKAMKSSYKIIGLGVIAPSIYLSNSNDTNISTKEEYDQIMIDLIYKLINSNDLPLQLFSNGDKTDYQYSIELCNKINSPLVSVGKRPMDDQELVTLVNKYSFVIANRLHAQIIAYSFGITTLGILWDEKIGLWYNMIGHNNRYFYLSDIIKNNLSDLIHRYPYTEDDRQQKEQMINLIHAEISNLL